MKYIFLLAILLLFNCNEKRHYNQEFTNLKTFAKVYGYVKYFHPSDEASQLDWDKFSIYGSKRVVKCQNRTELVATLNELFKPIAPSINFYEKDESNAIAYDLKSITPKNLNQYQLTYWQHIGVHFGMKDDFDSYRSQRVNAIMKIFNPTEFGLISQFQDPSLFRGRKVKFSAWVRLENKSNGTGHLRMHVVKADGTTGLYENMKENPITEPTWKKYEISGIVDSSATSLEVGCMLKGRGRLFADQVALKYQEGDEWFDVPLPNQDFENDIFTNSSTQFTWKHRGEGYTFNQTDANSYSGQKSAMIDFNGVVTMEEGEQLFEYHPKFGELIEKEIGQGLYCQIPLALYYNEHTFPKANEKRLNALRTNIEESSVNPTDLECRIGDVINTYNVFQHFYPYFNEVDVDWDKELDRAFVRSFSDKTENEHLVTLMKFTAALKDGHIAVSGGNLGKGALPIAWEWIEDKLVVTHVLDEELPIEVGDIITGINGQSTEDYFEEVNSRISAGTKGWLNYVAERTGQYGEKGSKVIVTIDDKQVVLIRNNYYFNIGGTRQTDYEILDNGAYYLNLTQIEMETINNLLPDLANAKSIICDLRGRPNFNHDFIPHLLKVNDTAKNWMRTPQIVYPDQENIVGYRMSDLTSIMQCKKPYLGDKKIIFITDRRAISYSETYLAMVKGYKLGTIVGEPTAGADGNKNSFDLPGGYNISFTGMKMVKLNGEQLHAVGILPDIPVKKTIAGLKQGKDEFLEKAIELTSN